MKNKEALGLDEGWHLHLHALEILRGELLADPENLQAHHTALVVEIENDPREASSLSAIGRSAKRRSVCGKGWRRR